MRADSPTRPNLWGLAAFSSPMLAAQAFEIAWRVYLPAYFAATAGLSLTAAGALIMALRLFDSLIDPLIAWASDHLPTRFGHRRPWIVAALIPLLVGAPGIFFPLPGITLPGLIISALLMHLGFMMLVTPHGGWSLELGEDQPARLTIIAVKTWFGAAGGILILALMALLERGLGVAQEEQVLALGLLTMLLFPVTVLLVLGNMAEPRLPERREVTSANPFRLFADIARIRQLHPILLLYLCTGFAESASSAVFLLFVSDALGLAGWGSALILVQSSLSLITLPFWRPVAERFGRDRLLILAYAWQAAMGCLVLLVPEGSIGTATAFVLLRGLCSGLDFLLLRAMVADIARASADAGLRNGASFYAVSNVTLKLAIGAGAWISLSLIESLPAFKTIVTGDEAAVRLSYAIPSVLAAVVALLILLRKDGGRNPSFFPRRSQLPLPVAPGE